MEPNSFTCLSLNGEPKWISQSNLPEELGRKVKEQPDPNGFIVKAAQVAIEGQMIAQRLARSQEQSERGEDATEEVEAFYCSMGR